MRTVDASAQEQFLGVYVRNPEFNTTSSHLTMCYRDMNTNKTSPDLLNKLQCHILLESVPSGASGASVRLGFGVAVSRARSQERINLVLIWILDFCHQIITSFVTHQWK